MKHAKLCLTQLLVLYLAILTVVTSAQPQQNPPPTKEPVDADDYYYTDVGGDSHDSGANAEGRAKKPIIFATGFRLESTPNGAAVFVVPVRANIECLEENCASYYTWTKDDGATFDDLADPSPQGPGVKTKAEFDYTVLRDPGTYLVKAIAVAPGLKKSTVTQFRFIAKDESSAFQVPNEGESQGKLEKPLLYADDGSRDYEPKPLNTDPDAPPYLSPVGVYADCPAGAQVVIIMTAKAMPSPCNVPVNMPQVPVDEVGNTDELAAAGFVIRFLKCEDILEIRRIGCFVARFQTYQDGYTPSDPHTAIISIEDIELDPTDPNSLDNIRPAADSGLVYVWLEFKFDVIMDPVTDSLDESGFKTAVRKVVIPFVPLVERKHVQVRSYDDNSVKFQIEVDELEAAKMYQVVDHPFAKFPFSQSLYREGLLNATSECTAYDELEVVLLAKLDKLSAAGLSTGIIGLLCAIAVVIILVVTIYSRHKMNIIRRANKVLAENKAELDEQEKVLEEDKKILDKREDDLEEMEKEMKAKMEELDRREKELEEKIKAIEEEENLLKEERSKLKNEQESIQQESEKADSTIQQMEHEELLKVDPELAEGIELAVTKVDEEINAQFDEEIKELEKSKASVGEEKSPIAQEEYDSAMNLLNLKRDAKKRLAKERVQERRRYLLTQMKSEEQQLLAAADKERASELVNELLQKEDQLQQELMSTLQSTPALEDVLALEEEFEVKHAAIVADFEAKRNGAVLAAKVAFDLDDLSESDMNSPRENSKGSPRDSARSNTAESEEDRRAREAKEEQELQEKLEKLHKEAPSQDQFDMAQKELKREIENKKKDQRERLMARRRVLALRKEKENKTKEQEAQEAAKQEEIRKAQEQAQSAKRKVASIFHKLLNNENKVQNLKEQYNSAQTQLEENVKKEKEKQRAKLMARRQAAGKA